MSKLFVAYDHIMGGYLKIAGHNWLRNEGWFRDKEPSICEVREQILFTQGYTLGKFNLDPYPPNVNDAEVWCQLDIDTYGKYYPNVKFQEVNLSIK